MTPFAETERLKEEACVEAGDRLNWGVEISKSEASSNNWKSLG